MAEKCCYLKGKCPFYVHMGSLFRYQVCDAMAYAQIFRENRCVHLSLEFSHLEKMLQTLDRVEAELKQLKNSIVDHLPPKQ